MPSSLTPEPRLPLEPEEYPLYRPPSRIGCSALSLVTLITVAVFSLLFWRVTPGIVSGISTISLGGLAGDTTPQAVSGGALATQTVTNTLSLTSTAVAAASPTPARTCVKVTGTGGAGTALKSAAKSTAANVIKDGTGKVGEGATFQVVGPDVVSGQDSAGKDIVWMHVMLPGDGRSGYALGKFLVPAPCP